MRSLRHRNFRLFLSGQMVSLVGTWMQNVAQSWLVYRLTGSALLLGVIGFLSQFPVFLLGPVAGTVADRRARHRLVVATQTAAMLLAFALAALTLSGQVRVWHVGVLAALGGVVSAFDIPARQSFLVEMVGRDDLANAIALNSSMFNGARAIGPALAGILVATLGEGWCFFLNGVSFLAVIASLLLMRLPPRAVRVSAGSPWRDFVEGVGFAWTSAPIRALLLLVGAVSLFGAPYTTLMPVFADHMVPGGPRTLGVLMGAVGIGALLGAISLAMRSTVRGLGRRAARAAALLGVLLGVFVATRSVRLAAPVLVGVGFAMMVHMAAVNTLLQSMVPDALRGRVMSLYTAMNMGMAPFGALLAGAVAHRAGAGPAVAAGGFVCLVTALFFRSRLPALREEARRLLDESGEAGSGLSGST
ncbi:MAG TPA: MFS transporter [Verrucomicrobiae bacterium]|nr:MFS transporter [Verrucomicrobiae bacterium]